MSNSRKTLEIPKVVYHFPSELKAAYILPLSDLQIGNPGFDELLFLGYRKWILDRPNAFTVLLGDIYEAPVVGNRASNFYEMALTPRQSRKKAKELFEPLAKARRILAAVAGNHDLRIYNSTGYDPVETLLEKLGLPTDGKNNLYDPMAIIVQIELGEGFTYKLYMTHGWGGARKTGAHVNKTEEMASVVTDADIYLTGHEHTLHASRWDSASIDKEEQPRQVFVGCGTFCRYTRFQKGIQRRMPNLGAPRIRLEGMAGEKHHKDIHVSI